MDCMGEALDKDVDEFDVPLGGLRAPQRIMLTRTHIEAAVGEVRFLSDRNELTESDAVSIWNALGGADSLPLFERTSLNTWNLQVTPEGADHSMSVQHGWVVAAGDRTLTITMLPAMLVLQTSKYEHYRVSLGEPLMRAVEAFVSVTDVNMLQRIGLRYINRLRDPGAMKPEYWQGHVRPPFAGPLLGDLGGLVSSSHMQAELQFDAFSAARIQSGVFREPGPSAPFSFLVDIDVFREQAAAFNSKSVEATARQLNRTALAILLRVLSEEHVQELGPVPIEGGAL